MKKLSYENLRTFVEEANKKYAEKATTLSGYGITDAMTAEEITSAISTAVAGVDHLTRKKVDNLEAIDTSAADADKYIYMIAKETPGENDSYDEYMIMDGKLEKVGNTSVSLSGYLKEDDFEGYTEEEIKALFTTTT